MIQFIYQNVFRIFKEKPVVLWGTSLLSILLTLLAASFGVLPIIFVSIAFVFSASMAMIYVKGYRKEEFSSGDLFAGFHNFLHVAGGMAWMTLWLLLWAMIPVLGPIIFIVKALSYSMTPYILMTRPEVSAIDALKLSMKLTKGYKGNMFLAYLVFAVAVWIVIFVLAMLTAIEALSMVFGFLLMLAVLILALFGPMFIGLLQAAFYDEIQKAIRFAEEHPGEVYQPEYLKLQPIYIPYPVEAFEAEMPETAPASAEPIAKESEKAEQTEE